MLFSVIDIETTGTGLKGNRITEICIINLEDGKITDSYTTLVNPLTPIPAFITGITGIDDSMVAQAPTFEEVAPKIMEMTKDRVFVAHSVNFDYGVIREEFKRLDQSFARKKLCTVRLSRKLVPGLRSYSLGKLCSSLRIPLYDRHRAKGDTEATVKLLQLLLKKDGADAVIAKFLNARSMEATLPPMVDKKTVDALPSRAGIYYFLNSRHQIIYVGKAKNIKKRVLGHFYDKSEHEIKLCKEVAHIDHKLSGSELLALLMESEEIKNHYPKFNRAQKRTIRQSAIFGYKDRRGIMRLGYGPKSKFSNALAVLNNASQCRDVLFSLCHYFGLCPKLCQLQDSKSVCSLLLRNIPCACQDSGLVEAYNQKVDEAIQSLQPPVDAWFIEQKGRHQEETAFIHMRGFNYLGYSFIDNSITIPSTEDLECHLIKGKNSPEARMILAPYIRRKMTVGDLKIS